MPALIRNSAGNKLNWNHFSSAWQRIKAKSSLFAHTATGGPAREGLGVEKQHLPKHGRELPEGEKDCFQNPDR